MVSENIDEPEYLRKMFIGRLSFETTDETFKDYFGKFGNIVDAIVMKDGKTKKSRGFGFVTFSNSSMVDAVQKARPHEIDGRTLETKRAVPREDVDRPDLGSTSKKIYIGNLAPEHDEDGLREYFEKFGTIEKVNIVTSKEGKGRRYGFVEFDDYDPVDKIILGKEHEINGKSVNVRKSYPKENQQGGGGRGGNARFGNGNQRGNNNFGGGFGNFGGGNNWGNNSFGGNQGGGNWGNRPGGFGGNQGGSFGGGGGFGNNFGGGNWNGGGNFGGRNQGRSGPARNPGKGGNRNQPYRNRRI